MYNDLGIIQKGPVVFRINIVVVLYLYVFYYIYLHFGHSEELL